MVKIVLAGIVKLPPLPSNAVIGDVTVLLTARTQPPIYGNGAMTIAGPLSANFDEV